MTGADQQVAELLNDLVPPTAEQGNWERVLRDAGVRHPNRSVSPRQRRLRIALSAGALAVAAAAFVPALRGQGYFWFLGATGEPQPLSHVIDVATGIDPSGHSWTLTAFRSKANQLCFQISTADANGAEECGAESPIGWMIATPDPTSGPFILGPVSSETQSVAVVTSAGTTTAQVFAAPPALGIDVKFYVAEISNDDTNQELTVQAFSPTGALIATHTIQPRK